MYIPGLLEWLIIGGVVMLLFGKKLPTLGRSLGKGIVEFKRGLKGGSDEKKDAEEIDQEPNEKPKALDYTPKS